MAVDPTNDPSADWDQEREYPDDDVQVHEDYSTLETRHECYGEDFQVTVVDFVFVFFDFVCSHDFLKQ